MLARNIQIEETDRLTVQLERERLAARRCSRDGKHDKLPAPSAHFAGDAGGNGTIIARQLLQRSVHRLQERTQGQLLLTVVLHD
jgi:hypothetical protein